MLATIPMRRRPRAGKWPPCREDESGDDLQAVAPTRQPLASSLLTITLWAATLLCCHANVATTAPSISVVTNGNQSVKSVMLWARASLFCKNYLIEHNHDLSMLPRNGPCQVNWYRGKNTLLCETVDGRCECIGSRKQAEFGGIVLVITRVTQAANGLYRCEYPSPAAQPKHRSYMDFQVAVDARTLHLSLYESGEETVVLPTHSRTDLLQELHCWFNGNPLPRVFWSKDGVKQDNTDPDELLDRSQNISFSNLSAEARAVVSIRLRSRKDMSKLEIRLRDFSNRTLRAARDLAGTYRCHVENSENAMSKSFKVVWNLPESEATASAEARHQAQACVYVDVGGLCHNTAGRFTLDPTSGNIIDCQNMSERCSSGETCLAVFKATEVDDGSCRYVQTIGRCHRSQVEVCSRACNASRSALHNSTVQCCCHGNMCNYGAHLPSTCLLQREVHHCNSTPGYAWNASSERCDDINECQRSHFPLRRMYSQLCPENMRCANTVGSFDCLCKEGYRRSDDPEAPCQDRDECVSGVHGCHANQVCTNTNGSYMCEGALVVADQCEIVSCAPCNESEVVQHASVAYRHNVTHCCWPHAYTCPRPAVGNKVGCFAKYDCQLNRLLMGMCVLMRERTRSSASCSVDCGHLPQGDCFCEGNLCNRHDWITISGSP